MTKTNKYPYKQLSSLLLVTALGSLQAMAQPKTNEKTSVADRLSGEFFIFTSLEDTRDEVSKSTLINVNAWVDLTYRMHRTLSFNLVPRFDVDNGYKNMPETSEVNKTNVNFRHLSADFKPVDFFDISVGALNQRKMHSSGFINNTAFPGIRATLKGTDSSNQPGIKAQTAIPTTTTLSTNTEDSEAMPTFNSVGLFYNLGTKYVWKSFANFYQFENLPSTVAKSSSGLGNTTETAGDLQKFKYKYAGVETGTSLVLPLTNSFGITPAGYWMQNSSAPAELNQGYRGALKSEYKIDDEMSVDATYEYFKIEPDAMVAFFGNRRYQTNRVGYLVELGVSFKDAFRFTVFGIERDSVYEIQTQTREQNIGITLETLGAKF